MSIVQHIRLIMLILALALAFAMPVCAQEDANDGSTCGKAILVDEDFTQTSFPIGERWFTAFTYDLPITVNFIPEKQDGTAKAPQLTVDFACNGQYDEDIQAILSRYAVPLPFSLSFSTATIGGKDGFQLSISDYYRNLLSQLGITRNVQVYVHINVLDKGDVDVKVDPTSRNCMDECHQITLPDTLDIDYNDTETANVIPMASWTEDSVRFTWTGTSDAELWLAKKTCLFTPSDQDAYVLAHFTLPAGEHITFSKDAINQFITTFGEGGMYYAKVISYSSAKLIVDRAPVIKPEATELVYDVATPITANDATVFMFDKKWTATHLEMPTINPCRIYMDTGKHIVPTDCSSYIRYYDLAYDSVSKQHYLNLSDLEIQLLADKQTADNNYLFCKIITSTATTITPTAWNIDDCLKNTIHMRSGDTILLPGNGTIPKMRMYYDEWKDYNIEFTRQKNNKALALGMTDDCDVTTPESTCTLYKSLTSTKATWSISQDTLIKIGAPEEGYYLWVFDNKYKDANICFTAKTPTPKEYTITTVTSPTEGGTVLGGGKYTANTSITLTATPASSCYQFSQWSDGNTNNPRIVTVTADQTYTAQFKLKEHTVKASVMGGGGSVAIINRKFINN